MDFPIHQLLSEEKSYQWLVEFLYDGKLKSPYSGSTNYIVNDARRAPVVQYYDKTTGKTFNIFTYTVFQGTHFACNQIVLIIRGFLQGVSTAQLSRELDADYQNLLELRHKFMECGYNQMDTSALTDKVTETDEMFQNAGEKGLLHSNPHDPPRRRANKKKGHGTYHNDRPPVVGTVGRASGQIRLAVRKRTTKKELNEQISLFTQSQTTCNTDEYSGYNDIEQMNRTHKTVCHAKKEYARDDDNDGIREVHTNTIEGMWTGLRNYLRIFRGVHKKYLHLYCAAYELKNNFKKITASVVQCLCFYTRILTT